MEQLFLNLKKFGRLSDELIERLRCIVRTKRIKKGEYLLKAGMVDHYVWFIESGLILVFQHGDNGRLVNWILEANDLAIATDSFGSRDPSTEYLVAEETTVVYYISHNELVATCRAFPEFFEIYNAIDRKYRKIENKQNALRAMPELDRFERLWNTRRHLFTRLKRRDLASFLRMTLAMFDNARKARGK